MGAKRAKLAFPVPEHRDRADHERRSGYGVGEHGGDELGRLAETHVVGEARAEPEAAEERQPADASFLIWAQHPIELRWRRDRRDGGVERVVEQRPEPTGGVHAGDLGAVGRAEGVEAEARAQHVGDGRLGAGASERAHRGEVFGAQLDPFAAHLHQRLFGVGGALERAQLGAGEPSFTERGVPFERHQRVHPEAGFGHHAGDGGAP